MLTNVHELQKVAFEKNLDVYEHLFGKIAEFEWIEKKDAGKVLGKIIEIIVEFEKNYPFLDEETVKIFNTKISIPVKSGRLAGGDTTEDNIGELYNNFRDILTVDILPTARKYLDQFKVDDPRRPKLLQKAR